MAASPVPAATPSHSTRRFVFKYAARGALAAIAIYALLGSSPINSATARSPLGPTSNSLGDAVSSTYWSSASSSESTGTPDHVKAAGSSEAPVPDAQSGVRETVMDENEDVDDFLKRLFEEDGIAPPEETPEFVQPLPTPLTKEEEAEQKRLKDIETKEKREDITGRHTNWEKKLVEAGTAELAELMEKIKEMRKEVVDGMRTKPELFNLLKKMQTDGFKQVENTDRYFLKMQNDGEKDEKVSTTWKKVVDKISKRLDTATIETTTFLRNWYQEVMAKEKEVFEAAAKKIDQLADDAQSDIGMDYAWLDDVTTDDWTRYHELKKEAHRWVEQFETIYNATHVDMAENVVVTELIQVETAMMRVAADLKQALDEVQKKATSWFTGETEVESSAAAESSPSSSSPAGATETEEPAPTPLEDAQDAAGSSTLSVPETSTAVPTHEEL